MGAVLSPKVAINIAGVPLSPSAINFVQSVRVELAKDKADLITIVLANPIVDVPQEVRTSALLWTDAMAFQPGNLIEVYFSFADEDPEFVAAGIIKKWMPRFPGDGMPMLELKCLGGAAILMDGTSDVNATKARSFDEGFTLTDMVQTIFVEYGFDAVTFVEDVIAEPAVLTVKKSGMKDYTFVRGLANIVGHDFYVTWDVDNQQWVAHWELPFVDYSDVKVFTWGPDFAAGEGDGNLIEFYPEFAVQTASTDVEVYFLDRDTKTWEQVIYPEEGPKKGKSGAPVFKWSGDDTTVEADLQAVGDGLSARTLRIKAGGTSVEVLPAQGFRSAEEAYDFAKAWWQARQDLLIQGNGSMIGYPKLRPGQVHELGGIGAGLSGSWYFSEVTHEYTIGNGYICRFTARKIIP